MERISLAVRFDEQFRLVLSLLDTTVEKGTYFEISMKTINYNNYEKMLFSWIIIKIIYIPVCVDYKAKIIALGTLCTRIKDHNSDSEIMKKKLQEMRVECGRLMHNLKSSNRLLDDVNKEKGRLEIERDTLVII